MSQGATPPREFTGTYGTNRPSARAERDDISRSAARLPGDPIGGRGGVSWRPDVCARRTREVNIEGALKGTLDDAMRAAERYFPPVRALQQAAEGVWR